MKKVLCLCIAFLLCFMTVGYAAEEATSTDAAVEIQDLFGKEENGVYENEFLGLGFNMEGWRGYNENEELLAAQIGKAVVPDDMSKMLEESGIIPIAEFKAGDGSGNFNINANNLGDTASIINAVGLDYMLDSFKDLYKTELSKLAVENLELETAVTKIGDQEFPGLKASYDMLKIHMFMRQFMFIRGTYLVTVTITTIDEAETEKIAQRFYLLK